MVDVLAGVVIGLTLVLAVWATGTAIRERNPGRVFTVGLLVAEVAVVVQVVVAVAKVIGGDRPAELATFLGYHVASLVILPLGVLWARAEPGRWGSGVLAVAAVTVAVMTVRMGQIWDLPRG